jgi:hypothetical protein
MFGGDPIPAINFFVLSAAALSLFAVCLLGARAFKATTFHWGIVALVSAVSLGLAALCVNMAASISAAV